MRYFSQVFKVILLIVVVIALSSCGKNDRADGKTSPPVTTEFGTTIPDNYFEIDLQKKLTLKAGKLGDQSVDTGNYLGLSNAFLELSTIETDNQRRTAYEILGQDLRRKIFNRHGLQYTISPDDSPYAVAAYTYTKSQISEMYTKSAEQGIAAVTKIASSLKVVPDDFKADATQSDPLQTLELLIGYLERLLPEIQSSGIKEEMVKSIELTIRTKHIKNLKNLRDGLVVLKKGDQSSVVVFLGIKSLLTDLPDDYLSAQAKAETDILLSRFLALAQQMDKASFTNPGPLLGAVVTLYDDAHVNKDMFPSALKIPLDFIGEDGRKLIAKDYSVRAKGVFDAVRANYVGILSGGLSLYGVGNAKKLVFEKMNQVAFTMINEKLNPFLKSLPMIVAEKVQTDTLASLKSFKENQDAIYVKTATGILKERVFGARTSYGVLEKARLKVVVTADNKTAFVQDRSDLGQLVSASAVAAGINSEINNAQIIERNSTASPLSENKDVLMSLFALISRLLIVGGYDDVNGLWSPALHVQVGGVSLQDYLNIKTYVPEDATFATPDFIPVQRNFRLEKREVQTQNFSVATQMSLLSAYSRSMKFFRSWETNVFDQSLAKLDYQSIEVFPKKSFYKLSVGLAAVVLKNLSFKNLLVVDRYNKIHRAGEEDLAMLTNRQSAVVVDYDKKGQKNAVTANDVATQLFAMVDFLEAARDFEKTQDPVLASNIPAIQAARPKLDLLVMGIANFAATRLQRKTGEFAASFSFADLVASSSSATLKDQLKLVRALYRAGGYLKAPIFQWAALDAYFSLKQNWIDSKIGFFKEILEESSPSSSRVELGSVLEFLQLAKEIGSSEYLNEKSRNHLKLLEQLVVEKILLAGFAATPQVLGLVPLSP